jgi:hypothetical protein
MSLTENEVRYQCAALADENGRLQTAHRQIQATVERFRAALEKIARSNTSYGIIAASALNQQLMDRDPNCICCDPGESCRGFCQRAPR